MKKLIHTKYVKIIIHLFLILLLLLQISCKKETKVNETQIAVPLSPSNLDYTITREKKSPYQSAMINLKWTDNSINETQFIIERKQQGSNNWQSIFGINRNFASLQITTYFYSNTIAYYREDEYRVCAYNQAGKSGYSNVIKVELITFPNGICTRCIP